MIEDEDQAYDKSSRWLIQHHGGSILRLAGIEKIATWRPAQAEVVQPSQMPDGLLEVRLEGEAHDDLFLLEVSTYPERRVEDQLTRRPMLVYPYRTPNCAANQSARCESLGQDLLQPLAGLDDRRLVPLDL